MCLCAFQNTSKELFWPGVLTACIVLYHQRLKELKQQEVGRQLLGKRRKEEKHMEKEMKRINEFADSRVQSSPAK